MFLIWVMQMKTTYGDMRRRGARRQTGFFRRVGMYMENFKDFKQVWRGRETANSKPFHCDVVF